MPIRIQAIRVSGFRALQNVEIVLGQQTVLIGTNNVGKTTFLNALQLAFGDNRWVNSDDFTIMDGVTSPKILVDVLIVPVDASGARIKEFSDDWVPVFAREIKLDDDDQQFFAFRTSLESEDSQGRRLPSRKVLNQWLQWDGTAAWEADEVVGNALVIANIARHIPLFFQNAQRDILEDIRQRTSFLGRALAKVQYSEGARAELQQNMDALNQQAVSESHVLKQLQTNLSSLGNTFGTAQGSADITPFAKDIRDLMKGVRMNFSDGSESFPMEYHGMGTRSWASLLALKAFVEIQDAGNEGAFYPLLALEEPEAHLHPNAQKQIMGQISRFPGQVIISTHSPYVVTQADLKSIRSLYKEAGRVVVGTAPSDLDHEAIRRIHREIIQTRGELLFARAWILFEGETEAQAIPLFFKQFFGREACDLGINLVGVSGAGNYGPFLRLAKALNIPWYIFSDGEENIRTSLSRLLRGIFDWTNDLSSYPRLHLIPNDLDYEGYILAQGYLEQCREGIEAIDGVGAFQKKLCDKNGTRGSSVQTKNVCTCCKQHIYDGPIHDYSTEDGEARFVADLLEKSQSKTKYAAPIAEAILRLPEPRNIPVMVRQLFQEVQHDLFPGGLI